MADIELDKEIEDLCYWMYESNGNSKYILAGRKPLHPDEATKMIKALVLRARLSELSNSFREFSKDVPFDERLRYYDERIATLEAKLNDLQ